VRLVRRFPTRVHPVSGQETCDLKQWAARYRKIASKNSRPDFSLDIRTELDRLIYRHSDQFWSSIFLAI
jgi:hypothetical protein